MGRRKFMDQMVEDAVQQVHTGTCPKARCTAPRRCSPPAGQGNTEEARALRVPRSGSCVVFCRHANDANCLAANRLAYKN